MASEWPVLSLREAGVTLIDCDHRTPPAADSGYPYVAIPQLQAGRIVLTGARRITQEHYQEWTKKAKPREHDIVLSRRCNPGETAYVPSGSEFALGQNLVLLRSDGKKIYPPFLRWLVRGPEWWEQIGKFLNVGAVFDSLRCADVPNFSLKVPPLDKQKAIVGILGPLDNKIELNRKMNETLEAMARVLFKSWFVDFDPVRAKAEGRDPGLPPHIAALFPDSFEDSELGEIPNGWRVGRISDCCLKIQNGGTPRRNIPQYWNDGNIPWLTSGEVRQTVITGTQNQISCLGMESSSAKWVAAFSTVVALYGATAGQVAFVSLPLTTNQAVCALIPKDEFELFNYLCMYDATATLENKAVGSAQQNISKSIVEDTEVMIPPEPLLSEFNKLARPLFDRWVAAISESKVLANVRDSLLPKLISGELRIKDAERLVEASI